MMSQGDTQHLYVEVLQRLDKDLMVLESLTESKNTSVRHLQYKYWSVVYLMGNASGKGFGLSQWR